LARKSLDNPLPIASKIKSLPNVVWFFYDLKDV